MKRLRKHVEASQSNVGLQLDSLINQNRRSILLSSLADIRAEAKLAGNSKNSPRLASARKLLQYSQERTGC